MQRLNQAHIRVLVSVLLIIVHKGSTQSETMAARFLARISDIATTHL